MKFISEIKLNGSAEKAWEVLGMGFGNICEWTSTLSSSEMDGELGVGGTRVCVNARSFGPFKQGLLVKERLTIFDPENKTFAYEALTDSLPPFIKKAQNQWTIEAVDENRCVIHINALAEFTWPFSWFGPAIKWMINRDFEKLVGELQYRIEHDRPHPDAQGSLGEFVVGG